MMKIPPKTRNKYRKTGDFFTGFLLCKLLFQNWG